ncbi:MAG: hypothetical protein Q9208_002423 [Pyrenodesmia sp. 3 TL-2023]
MKFSMQSSTLAVLASMLSPSMFAQAFPNLLARDPATSQASPIPQVGTMAQGAATVLASVDTPGTDTTVTFSRFASPAPIQIRQTDSLTCLVEALQEIYSRQKTYGISTHLPAGPWTYSGSQQPKNANCLVMHNRDKEDHLLTWGIVVESLRAVALGLSNTTFSSCRFDVYNNKKWGHLGNGSLGMQMGEGSVMTA